jgi:hypothetical protein
MATEPTPSEIVNGVPIYHSQGRFLVYRHINLILTPENTILSNDPRITKKLGLSRKPQNYRQNILDEKSENFTSGQFQVYIPVEQFPLAKPKKGYMILRMPSTSPSNKIFIKEKQDLYLRIVEMIKNNTGSVSVVVEIPDSKPHNLFFRDARGRYVDYVGQFTREEPDSP